MEKRDGNPTPALTTGGRYVPPALRVVSGQRSAPPPPPPPLSPPAMATSPRSSGASSSCSPGDLSSTRSSQLASFSLMEQPSFRSIHEACAVSWRWSSFSQGRVLASSPSYPLGDSWRNKVMEEEGMEEEGDEVEREEEEEIPLISSPASAAPSDVRKTTPEPAQGSYLPHLEQPSASTCEKGQQALQQALKRPVLPWELIGLIIRRLPLDTPQVSYRWLCSFLSQPRPALLLPGHKTGHELYYPTRFRLRGETGVTLTQRGQVASHNPLTIPWNFGVPFGDTAPRLVGGHPSHLIFVHEDLCIIVSINSGSHNVHKVLLPADHEIIRRGAISTPIISSDPKEAPNDPMILLANDTHLFGLRMMDHNASWTTNSLEGRIRSRVTDIVFDSGSWFVMDDKLFLYKVTFSGDVLFKIEQVTDAPKAQFRGRVKRHWLMSWPDELLACLCFETKLTEDGNAEDLTVASYTAYLLRVSKEEGEYYWCKLHHLQSCSIFPNWASGGVAFAYQHPERWGLRKGYVYHTDLTCYDNVILDFSTALPSAEENWPFPMWVRQDFPVKAASRILQHDISK